MDIDKAAPYLQANRSHSLCIGARCFGRRSRQQARTPASARGLRDRSLRRRGRPAPSIPSYWRCPKVAGPPLLLPPSLHQSVAGRSAWTPGLGLGRSRGAGCSLLAGPGCMVPRGPRGPMLVQCAGTTRCGRELFGPGPEKGRASELAETWARPAGSSGERRPSLERLLNRLCQGQKRTRVPPEQGRAGESLPAPPPAASPRIAQTRLENPRQSQPRPRPSSAHACRGPCPLRVSASDATPARRASARPSPGLSIGEGRPWVPDYGGRLLGPRRGRIRPRPRGHWPHGRLPQTVRPAAAPLRFILLR